MLALIIFHFTVSLASSQGASSSPIFATQAILGMYLYSSLHHFCLSRGTSHFTYFHLHSLSSTKISFLSMSQGYTLTVNSMTESHQPCSVPSSPSTLSVTHTHLKSFVGSDNSLLGRPATKRGLQRKRASEACSPKDWSQRTAQRGIKIERLCPCS